jgi:hypothetical protein
MQNFAHGRDLRRYERVACSRFACSCSVRPESKDNIQSEKNRGGVVLSNISPDGISFETNISLSEGDYLLLEIRPIEGPELAAKIKVLHSRHSEKNGFFVIGSQFEEMSEGDRQNLHFLIATIERMENDLAQFHASPKLPNALERNELRPY